MLLTKSLTTVVLLASVLVRPAHAQAPDSGPLVLRVPVSTRAVALGNAWTAGRDQDVIFYNPAQLIGARTEFAVSLGRHGGATSGSMTSVYAAGPLSMTFGWGVHLVNFTTSGSDAYPFAPDILVRRGVFDAQSALVVAGGAFVLKGFRIGASGKYVSDRLPAAAAGSASHHTFLADIGVARNIVGGVGAVSFQNVGHTTMDGDPRITIPRQVSLGWSATKPAGPLDLAIVSQLTMRHGWTSPGAGLEASYSWIEGYSVALRAGVRRPETPTERPVAIGAAFTADRLTLDYAVQFFDAGHRAQRVTLRWR